MRTSPANLRTDNGRELAANALRDWCRFSDVGTAYIEPGSPWDNTFVESFNGNTQDELLAMEIFDTVTEARPLTEQFSIEHNAYRSHSAHRQRTPAEFAKVWWGNKS